MENMTVTVKVDISVSLSRVVWEYMTAEDYYVRVGKHIAGIVGYAESNDRWHFSSIHVADNESRKTYATKTEAVKALVSLTKYNFINIA